MRGSIEGIWTAQNPQTPRPAFEGGPGTTYRPKPGGLEGTWQSRKSSNRPTFASPVLPRSCTSWRQPSQHLGTTEEGTALPDAQPAVPSTGRPCARALPSAPDPHHPRPWRRGSLFGDGPRRPLSADERRTWLARADAERRAGRLTATHFLVARALLRRLGVDGQCDPAHATLAHDAGCDPSSVLRALSALQAVDLVAWERRLVRRPWPAGGRGATRAEQTSNAYELLLPNRPIAPREERRCSAIRLRPDCNRQVAGETPSQLILRGLPELTEAELVRLKAIQTARWAQLGAEWHAKRAERWRGRG